MCRNIKDLHNFHPAATSEEVTLAALQYVRKVAGTTKPSQLNQQAFDEAVHDITHITQHLLESLVTQAAPRDRAIVAEQARAKSVARIAGIVNLSEHVVEGGKGLT